MVSPFGFEPKTIPLKEDYSCLFNKSTPNFFLLFIAQPQISC